ncbi:MAG TPA: VCBS repeat-containing protein [Gemmataceae bacterium]
MHPTHAARSRHLLPGFVTAVLFAGVSSAGLCADEFTLHTFQRQRLTGEYYSEGANAGDINRDGHADVVYGPYWFEGPVFETKHEIYPARPQPRERYADNFFNWVHDFNGDGWNDVLVVGFPGTPAYVYENPKAGNFGRPWKKHTVFPSVANESPHFTDLTGDATPELVCTSGGFFGFATVNREQPFGEWKFHAISVRPAPKQFGHGLGVGDVNGDGRMDILTAQGWFEQPEKDADKVRWEFHEAAFTDSYGGAEMHAYDVDGDGDNDVITSLAAHDFGLAWYEQDKSGGKTVWHKRLIVGDRPEQNRYGVVFSEPHSVALADIDGDGLKDIITGKTYYSHHKQSPMWDAGAVVYWFRLVRTGKGVDWVPHRADGEAGIGRQITVADVNGDRLPDIVVGGMVGSHVLLHRAEKVSEAQWKAAQPKPVKATSAALKRGPRSAIDRSTGRVPGAIEGEDLKVLKASAGKTSVQAMGNFRKDAWSGGKQLIWAGAKPGARLELEFDVEKSGKHDLAAVFTMARDYGVAQVYLDDKPLGDPIDFYNYPDVITSGVLHLGAADLEAGKHRLAIEIKGAYPSALKAYLVGLDYLLLKPAR